MRNERRGEETSAKAKQHDGAVPSNAGTNKLSNTLSNQCAPMHYNNARVSDCTPDHLECQRAEVEKATVLKSKVLYYQIEIEGSMLAPITGVCN